MLLPLNIPLIWSSLAKTAAFYIYELGSRQLISMKEIFYLSQFAVSFLPWEEGHVLSSFYHLRHHSF